MGARESILYAADQIFGDIGFDAATTREIAEACGVNKALIHYHFKNKEGLLISVLDYYYEILSDEVQNSLAAEGDFRQKFTNLVTTYSDFLAGHQSFCRIVQREASGGRNAALIRERMIPLFSLGKQLVEQQYPHAAEAGLAAEHLLVSVYGMIVTWFTYSEVLEPLLGAPALSGEYLQSRKEHLKAILQMLFAALDASEEAYA